MLSALQLMRQRPATRLYIGKTFHNAGRGSSASSGLPRQRAGEAAAEGTAVGDRRKVYSNLVNSEAFLATKERRAEAEAKPSQQKGAMLEIDIPTAALVGGMVPVFVHEAAYSVLRVEKENAFYCDAAYWCYWYCYGIDVIGMESDSMM
jgi:hypothetical protein